MNVVRNTPSKKEDSTKCGGFTLEYYKKRAERMIKSHFEREKLLMDMEHYITIRLKEM